MLQVLVAVGDEEGLQLRMVFPGELLPEDDSQGAIRAGLECFGALNYATVDGKNVGSGSDGATMAAASCGGSMLLPPPLLLLLPLSQLARPSDLDPDPLRLVGRRRVTRRGCGRGRGRDDRWYGDEGGEEVAGVGHGGGFEAVLSDITVHAGRRKS